MKKKIDSASFKITPPGGAVKRKKFIKELANSSCFKITPPGGAVVRTHRLLHVAPEKSAFQENGKGSTGSRKISNQNAQKIGVLYWPQKNQQSKCLENWRPAYLRSQKPTYHAPHGYVTITNLWTNLDMLTLLIRM